MRPLAAKLSIALATVALAAGCGDGAIDGATGGSGGADPSADPDADYLSNADESKAGTDPSNPDTDGDTYLDGDEVLIGTNPLDPASRIYRGGWPFQRKKDSIADPGFASSPAVGATAPHFVGVDQFGQEVDLYDFALHGKPVVIDMSALWCDACKDMAKWLGGEPSMLDAKPELAPIVDKVASGEIYWITVVFEDAVGNAAGPAQAASWAATFPNAKVAVLADDDRKLYSYLYPGGFPSIQVLDEDMSFRVYDRFDYEKGLASLLP